MRCWPETTARTLRNGKPPQAPPFPSGKIHNGGPRAALSARNGGSSPQGSAQGSSTSARSLNLGIHQGFQFSLFGRCERGARVPRRTPLRHQAPDSLLLPHGKEFIGLLGLDNDQRSNLIGRKLSGQGVQSRSSGLCKRLMSAREGTIHLFALLGHLWQDSYLSHILDCSKQLWHNGPVTRSRILRPNLETKDGIDFLLN